MKRSILASLIGITFATMALAETADEYRGFAVGIDETIKEKTFEIHYPSLVRWVQNGIQQESYRVPGCFYVDQDQPGGNTTKFKQFLDAIEIVRFDEKASLPLVDVNGTTTFADLDVPSYYVAFYHVRTKDGRAFGEVARAIFGADRAFPVFVKYSRGCKELNSPPFAKPIPKVGA